MILLSISYPDFRRSNSWFPIKIIHHLSFGISLLLHLYLIKCPTHYQVDESLYLNIVLVELIEIKHLFLQFIKNRRSEGLMPLRH
jgi:hypothetical protein